VTLDRTLYVGNCTTAPFVEALQILLPTGEHLGIHVTNPEDTATWDRIRSECSESSTHVFVLDSLCARFREQCPTGANPTVVPSLQFWGFHPDVVYANTDAGLLLSGLETHWNSRIVLSAFIHGLPIAECHLLFNEDQFARLGYLDVYSLEVRKHLERFAAADLNGGAWFDSMAPLGTFMHGPNHPVPAGIGILASQIVANSGVRVSRKADFHRPEFWNSYLTDYLDAVVWPVYPEIADHLGVSGCYLFKRQPDVVDLQEFIERCYSRWESLAIERGAVTSPQGYGLLDRSTLIRP